MLSRDIALELLIFNSLSNWVLYNRGAPGRKISVRPDNRTGLIEAGYRPDWTLFSIVSYEGLFSELGNDHYEKRSRPLPQSGEKLYSLRHNLLNFDSQSQIQFFDTHTLFLSCLFRLFKIFILR